MASTGIGRHHVHILNTYDDEDFGGWVPAVWVSPVQQAVSQLGSGQYQFYWDSTHATHSVSPHAMQIVNNAVSTTIQKVTDTVGVSGHQYKTSLKTTALDSVTFTYHLRSGPNWLKIDSTSGVLSGNPTTQDVGSGLVNVNIVGDYGVFDEQTFSINVSGNHPPVIVSSPIFTAHEDTLYQYQVVAFDPDSLFGDTLSFSLTQKPSWLSISASGLISGMPRGANVGDSAVTVQVSDGHGGIVTQSFILNTIHTNHAPIFISQADSIVTEDSLYSYRAYATDQDSALFGDKVH